MENDQQPLDGVEPPEQSQTESYLIARERIAEKGLHLEAPVSTMIRAMMDHSSFLLLLDECVATANQRFGDTWKEIVNAGD